ncbi:MAG: tandem-95 repeat protein, partial [Proteobacteria bacterium]|nr:tandem-95 repeat protein [Pseudomonadota bacterium]
GSAGEVLIGSQALTMDTLLQRAGEVAAWGEHLAPGADLLVYGCDVAAGSQGEQLIQSLAQLTGVDVAASVDRTGDAAQGGNWELERQTGAIHAQTILDAGAQADWHGMLAISTGNTSSAVSASAGASSLTWSHTVASGSEGMLMVNVAVKGTSGATTVTYGGVSLTRLGTITNGSGVKQTSELWYLKAPTAGTANVVVTLPASNQAVAAGSTNFFGVDQTTPFGTYVSATGTGGTPTVTVASALGDIVIDAAGQHARSSVTPGTGQTQLWEQRSGTSASDISGASSTKPGAASVTMSWTSTGTGNAEWATGAVALKASLANHAPTGTAKTLTTLQSQAYTFTAADFGFSDPNDSPANALLAVKITTLPGAGSLTLNGVAVTAGQFVSATNINAGKLTLNPVANTSFTFQVQDDGGTLYGGSDIDATARTMTINVTPVSQPPVNTVPGAQTTNEDTNRVLSAANGNAISISDADAGGNPMQVTLSVTNGTLTLGSVSGLSFVAGNGVANATMTFRGTLANINAALNGLAYTPTANYNGPATLTLRTVDSVLLSLNIDASLKGRYGFENAGALGTDTSPAAGYPGTVVGGASAAVDGTRGNVVNLDGTGYVQATGRFGNPANVTLAAWVNLTTRGTTGSEVISLGDSVLLRLDDSTYGLVGGYYNGTTWVGTSYNTTLAGTGWHHVAFSFNDAGDSTALYLDGKQVAAIATTDSISYTQGVNSIIGRHGNGGANWNFTGKIDEARVYSRVLSASEVAALATDLPLEVSSTVAVTVNSVNDAPSGTSKTITTLENQAYTFAAADFGFSDPNDSPANALLAVKVTTLPGAGSLTLNGVAVTAGQFVAATDINAGKLKFTPAANTSGTGYASFTFQVQDDGGTANGGVDLDSTPKTITINVNQLKLVVDTTSDTSDGNTSSIAALLTSKGADGSISLREAITAINNTSTGGSPVHLEFAIAGTGIHTITLGSALPAITKPVIIDATTDDSFAAQGNRPAIVLSGNNSVVNGLRLNAGSGGSTIRGLVVTNFTDTGIAINASNGNTIAGNWLGLNSAGTGAAGNNVGVSVTNATNNIIGGTSAADRNVISGNSWLGVYFAGSSASNQVLGNYIGTNAAGTGSVANNFGIVVSGSAQNNTIGGTSAGARNVISGNTYDGLQVNSTSATANLIQGNYIGTNAAGSAALANLGMGIVLNSANNTVGGTAAGAGNVISGNGKAGVNINGASATGNLVAGNYIGTNAAGTAALGNSTYGIQIDAGSANNNIGGTTAAHRNVISGQTNASYLGAAAIVISGAGTSGNVVEGNYLGTNAAGMAALGNHHGVIIDTGATNNRIGGTTAGARNLIDASTWEGVIITAAGTTGNLVQGNYIGLAADGTTALGNSASGVLVQNSASNNTVGGTAAGAGNTIANNGNSGVYAMGGTGNAILGNSIYGNSPLGIDLGAYGVTDNDVGDADTGANNLQNFPVLTQALTNGSNQLNVNGTLNSNASSYYRIEFFASPTANASGYGEGKQYLGFVNVATDASGNASFTQALTAAVPAGYAISATATQSNASYSTFTDTSEFSAVRTASLPNHAPSGANKTITTLEDQPYTFGVADFGFSDASDSPANALLAVKISTLPGAGSLTLNGVAVTAGQFVSATDITAGKLKFTPAANANGAGYASFTFQVQDDGGAAGGGADLDPTAKTMTVNVTAVNDAPVNHLPPAQTTAFNTPLTLSGANAISVSDVDSNPLQVTLTAANGKITLSTTAGLAFNSGTGTGDATMTFVGTAASINAALDGLVLSPTAGFQGATSITVSTNDLGGQPVGVTTILPSTSTNGQYDKQQVATQLSFSTAGTVTHLNAYLTMSKVNDVRVGLYADASGQPGALLAETSTSLAIGTGWYSFDIPDVAVSAGNYWLAIAPNKEGVIYYSATGGNSRLSNYDPNSGLASPWSGTYSSNTWQMSAYAGFVATGSTAQTTTDALVVTVGNNTAPTLDNSKTPALNAQNEDCGPPSGAVGTLVSSLVDFAVPTGQVDNVTDPDSGALLGVAITAANTSNGSWHYSTDGGSTWNALGAVSNTNARLLAADANTRIYFQPNADWNGTMANALSFRAWDQASGSNGGLANTSSNGGTTAFSTATANASLVVNAVNDAPTITNGATVGMGASYSENAPTAGFGVSGVINAVGWNDPDTGAVKGMVLTGSTGNGTWQYSTDLVAWTSVGSVSATNGLLLADTSWLRYVPDNLHGETPTIQFRAWDMTSGTASANGAPSYANPGAGGGTTAFSTQTANAFTVIDEVNDAPAGSNKTVTTLEDVAYTFGVADFGFTDTDGNALLAVKVSTLPGAGSLTLNGVAVTAGQFVSASDIGAGKLKFTPTADANGAGYASFTFQVQDDGGTANGGVNLDPAAKTMTVNVTPVNDAPTGTDKVFTGVGSGKDVVLSAGDFGFSDPKDSPANALAAVIVDVPTGGQLLLNGTAISASTSVSKANLDGGKLVFRAPVSASPSTPTIAFRVQDDGGTANGGVDTSVSANTLTFQVSANQAPVAGNYSFSTNEDQAHSGALPAASDADGDSVTYALGAGASHGSATVNGDGSFSYTPTADFNGSDAFTYTISDGKGGSNSYTVSVTVTPVNDAPAGSDKTFTGVGSGKDVVLSAADFGFSDPKDSPANALAAVIVDVPTGGQLLLNGTAISASTSVSKANLDGGKLVFRAPVSASPSTPSIAFRVQDDGGTANGGVDTSVSANTLTFQVSANQAPVAGNYSFSTNEDQLHSGTLPAASDADGDTVTYALGTGASHGSATVNGDGSFSYTPTLDFSGADSFAYTVSDGKGGSNTYTVSITVTAVNDAPVNTVPGAQTVNEDTALVISGVSVADADGNLSSVQLTVGNGTVNVSLASGASISAGANGSATLTLAGTQAQINAALAAITYQGSTNFNGSDTLTVLATDALGATDSDTVAITVTAVNDAPVVSTSGGNLSYTENDPPTPVDPGLNITDVDSTTLSGATVSITAGFSSAQDTLGFTDQSGITGSWNASTGMLTLSGTASVADYQAALRSVTYFNNSNQPTQFDRYVSFAVTDDFGAVSAGATRQIHVTLVNDAPVNSVPGAQTVNEDATLVFSSANGNSISVSDVDANGNDLRVTLTAANGTLTLASTSGLTFSAGANGSATMTINGKVNLINAALNGLAFTPDADFNGAASLSIFTNDMGSSGSGGAQSDSDSVAITVSAVNDAPTGADKVFTGIGSGKDVVLSAADFGFSDPKDSPANALAAVIVDVPTGGQLLLNGTAISASTSVSKADLDAGKLVFRAPSGASPSTPTLSFRVQDDGGTANGGVDTSVSANTLTFQVSANQSPVAGNYSFSTNEDQAHSGSLPVASDADGDSVTYALGTAASHGSATVNGDGSFSYTPTADFSGADSFTYTVSDGKGGSNTYTVNVTVNPVNDPPTGQPTIVGSPSKGQTLTANSSGVADADGLGAFSYQWLREGAQIA